VCQPPTPEVIADVSLVGVAHLTQGLYVGGVIITPVTIPVVQLQHAWVGYVCCTLIAQPAILVLTVGLLDGHNALSVCAIAITGPLAPGAHWPPTPHT